MTGEIRLLQTFLSRQGHGVYEVNLIVGDDELLCSCPGFKSRKACKHVRFVKARMDDHDGGYMAPVDPRALDDMPDPTDATSWRRFVLRYTKPEVI